ncbi:MAG: YqgE/AlgH family protein [Deltaproteobacteria bacterium]|jgi:putative transcriptional regulator
MENNIPDSIKGQFLMAMPSLLDQNFYQTVTCICEYTPVGAVGIVVNRVHPDLSGKDIFNELKMESGSRAESIPIHIGGPVHMGEIFVLHGPPFGWEGCRMITPRLAISNTRDILESVAMDRGPTSFIIALGCAGWGPGQLESEIIEDAWLTSPIFEEIIFDMPIEIRWEESLKKIGVDPGLLLNTSGHA